MKLRHALLAGLILVGVTSLHAQTNADASTSSAPARSGPVVSPPSDLAPANLPPASTAPPASPTPDVSAPPPDAAPAPSPDTQPTTAPQGNTSPPPADDIKDIRPPFFFLRSWFWLWIALGIMGGLALLVLLWLWLRPHRLLSPKSAYDLALEKLEQARALLREENPVPYAVFVSETVRSYLGQRFLAPSTRRTTEEFLRQMETDRTTPLAEHRDLLREFLQSCDLVKFARYQPHLSELEQVQERALTFVTATKPVPTSDAKNGRHP
jgi:hypothetical protein